MESDVEISNCRANIQKSAVFIFATLYVLPSSYRGFNLYDEGIRLYGAMRVMHGAIPYRDFFSIYGPAQFYWPAILFKTFGPQVLVFRANAAFFIGVAAVALFTLTRHANVKPTWALMPITALLLPLNRGDVLLSCDPALSLVLSAGALVTGSW